MRRNDWLLSRTVSCNFTFPPLTANDHMIIASLSFSFAIPLCPPRHPPEMVPILALGWLGFISRIVVSVKGIRPFLFFFIVDVSRDRRLSPFTREPEGQWDRIILREEGRTSSPGYDVSRQRKKGQLQKGITYEIEKESEEKESDHLSRFESGSAFSRRIFSDYLAKGYPTG